MRTFEIILLVLVTLLPFIKRPLVRRIPANYILLFIGFILVLHLLTEGWRWQMIPAYLLTVLVAWRINAVDASHPARLTFPRAAGFAGLILLLLVAWVLPAVLPVFSLPEPQGPYSVGTVSEYILTGRDEMITSDPDDERELMIKIWYPGEAGISEQEWDPYIDPASRAGFASKYGLPGSALNYLDRVKTHVYPGIPVAEGAFPVLLFSHGYGSKATGYYALLTEIASQGYVIINMNHTYESLGVTYPDGRMAFFDYEYQRGIAAGSMEMVQPLRDAFRDGLSYEERHPIVREGVRDYFEGEIQARWVNDMVYILDQLDAWNNEGVLKGKLDLNRIGVIGHSVGGGAAGRLAMRDERIRAAANLDGIQWGTMIDTAYQIPYLYVSADWPADHEDINAHIYVNKSTDYFYETKLLQSGHPNFMDIPLMVPVPALSGSGNIDPALGLEIVNRLVTSFFDRHLKNNPAADPEAVAEEYDVLQMEVYRGDSVR